MIPELDELDFFFLDTESLEKKAEQLREGYLDASPYPHIVIDDFLPKYQAEKILDVFPEPSSEIWLDWKLRDTIHQPKKQGIGHASRLNGVSPYLLNVLNTFNSYPFLNFLEKLTGIEKLLPDPCFVGGGLHQTLTGGKLAIHTDFNNYSKLSLYRRVNVIFFLNKEWQPEYNGNLELWSKGGEEIVRSVEPFFNRIAIFTTTKHSPHGHPVPLNTPKEITRKSLALYFYTVNKVEGEKYDGLTDWYDDAVE